MNRAPFRVTAQLAELVRTDPGEVEVRRVAGPDVAVDVAHALVGDVARVVVVPAVDDLPRDAVLVRAERRRRDAHQAHPVEWQPVPGKRPDLVARGPERAGGQHRVRRHGCPRQDRRWIDRAPAIARRRRVAGESGHDEADAQQDCQEQRHERAVTASHAGQSRGRVRSREPVPRSWPARRGPRHGAQPRPTMSSTPFSILTADAERSARRTRISCTAVAGSRTSVANPM